MNELLRNTLRHLVTMALVFLMMGLVLLGSAAPYGQDDPHATPTPKIVVTGMN